MLAVQIKKDGDTTPPPPPPSSGEVESERLSYDNVNKAASAKEIPFAVAGVSESGKPAKDSVISAFAAEVREKNASSVETAKAVINARASEYSRASVETVSTGVESLEFNRPSIDTTTLGINSTEKARSAFEKISNTVSSRITETANRAKESITSVFVPATTFSAKAKHSVGVEIDYMGFVQEAYITNFPSSGSTWTQVFRFEKSQYTQFARMEVTSSGLAGTNSATATGTLNGNFKDLAEVVQDLDIVEDVVLDIKVAVVPSGTNIQGRSFNLDLSYQLSDAEFSVNFASFSGSGNEALSERYISIVIPNVTLSDLSNLIVSADATAVSGTGLSSSISVRAYLSRLMVIAAKEY